MGLRLNGSTSGYSEIAAPAVAGDQTFTLPGTGGNIITDVSDLTTQVKSATNATGSAPIYSCRAWVNFDGTGTVAIRASGNVSSITDNGTGNYTVNFTTAMPDANYVVSCESAPDNVSLSAGAWIVGVFSASGSGPLLKTTTQVQIRTSDLAGGGRDHFNGGVAIFR